MLVELAPVDALPVAAPGPPVVEPDATASPDEVVLPLGTPAEAAAPDAPALAVDPDCEPPVATAPAELPAPDAPPPLETARDVPVLPQAHNRSATA